MTAVSDLDTPAVTVTPPPDDVTWIVDRVGIGAIMPEPPGRAHGDPAARGASFMPGHGARRRCPPRPSR